MSVQQPIQSSMPRWWVNRWTNRARRVGTRLVGYALIFALAISVVLSGVQLWQSRQDETRRLNTLLDQLAAGAETHLTDLVWKEDPIGARHGADNILKVADVSYVAVRSKDETLAEVGVRSAQMLARTYPLTLKRSERKLELGSFTIGVDMAPVEERLWLAYWGILGRITLLICLVISFVLLLFKFMVTRHLSHVARFVAALTPETLDRRLELKRSPAGPDGGDEFDHLVGGVARMQASLAGDIKRREKAEADVRRLNEVLEARVAERTKQLETEQHASEIVLELTRSAHLVADVQAGVWIANPRIVELVGVPENLVDNGTIALAYAVGCIAAVDGAAAEQLVSVLTAMAEGRMNQSDLTVPWRRPVDGAVIWLQALTHRVVDSDGRVMVRGSIQDITRQKADEQALAEARDIADAANKAKSEFLANMSHEIRTPLNGMLGMVQLLQRGQLDGRQRDYVDTLRYSADNLLSIINDILDFSKIEAGHLQIEVVPFVLSDVLENLLSLLSVRAEAKGLELILDVAADLPGQFLGDPLRLGQILSNLAGNALKFTAQGSVTLRLRGEPQPGAGGDSFNLRVSVEDTGIGITPEQEQRLFQSFQQADTSTSRRFGGTGLGLVISRRLVELMGGRIGVKSLPGQGSIFTFTLPLGVIDEEAATTSTPRRAVHHARNILAVDDHPTTRQVVGEMLLSFGDRVTLVDGGAAAIAALRDIRASYDLLLLDWKMPDIDGLAVVRWLSAHAATLPHGAPEVVMMTGHSMPEVRQQAEAAGVSRFLPKPFTASALYDALVVTTRSARQPPVVAAGRLGGLLTGARILLVDDNPINIEVARDFLESEGAVVAVAENGLIAVQMTQTQDFDVVLMDIQMPVMDGFAATAALRAAPRTRDLPVIAMTANGLAGDRERSLAGGMNDHLVKPIVFEDVTATLLRWLPPATNPSPTPALPVAVTRQLVHTETSARSNYIDTEMALGRLRGNVKKLMTLLGLFVEQYRDFMPIYRAATPDEMAALAHKLKGGAGSLSMTALQDISAAHEARLKSRQTLPSEAIDTLGQILGTTLAEAATLIQANAEPAANGPKAPLPDRAATRAARDATLHSLRRFERPASLQVSTLLAGLTAYVEASTVDDIKRRIAQFDFAGAIEKIDRVALD